MSRREGYFGLHNTTYVCVVQWVIIGSLADQATSRVEAKKGLCMVIIYAH